MIYYFILDLSNGGTLKNILTQLPNDISGYSVLKWDTNETPRYSDLLQEDLFINAIPDYSMYPTDAPGVPFVIEKEIFNGQHIETAKFEAFKILRLARNKLLSASDWTQLPDNVLSDEQKVAWVNYRQLLRDLPANTSNPYIVDWPVKPE